ncbi:hypothetical protein DID88_008248 [Monilinia fructigena]|uniref:Uncharacterized protein n=1 Tax=Monilinia fructigena TaxID=38457 RepID=A0A395J767_9HELO|nr:hypothetical protein DID88_008248 [Monilinia fructigena]
MSLQVESQDRANEARDIEDEIQELEKRLEAAKARLANRTSTTSSSIHPTDSFHANDDDAQDASIMCTVGRRASIAQGRALLSIWDRSFSAALSSNCSSSTSMAGVVVLKEFSLLLRSTSSAPKSTSGEIPPISAHLAPLFGTIASTVGMGLEQTAYVFMLSHVKALLSAAVRASMFGPYHAQKILASEEVQMGIKDAIKREWETTVEGCGSECTSHGFMDWKARDALFENFQ